MARRKRNMWREQEVNALMDAVRSVGRKWTTVRAKTRGVIDDSRTVFDLRDKWRVLERNGTVSEDFFDEEEAAAPPPPPPQQQQQQQAGTSMQVPSADVGAAVGPPMAERQAAGGQPSGPKGRRTNKPWSEQEVKALIDAARRFGCRWKTLRAETLGVIEDFRTNVDFKDKWRVLERNGTVSEDDFEKPTRRPS